MKVELLNTLQLQRFVDKGCAEPNYCYKNCAQIVIGLQVGNYVLCRVTDSWGHWHGHAVVQINGAYYDPTLQKNSSLAQQYKFFRSFTRQELEKFMKESGAKFESNGFSGFAPALFDDDSIKCVRV